MQIVMECLKYPVNQYIFFSIFSGYYCNISAFIATPPPSTSGDRCPKGHYCPAQSIAPTPCPIGYYYDRTGAQQESDCVICTKGQLFFFYERLCVLFFCYALHLYLIKSYLLYISKLMISWLSFCTT